MRDAYRDDLDVAVRRAAELDRANEELRARNAELEAQLAPKSEEELARARLEAARARERAEREARERARREEEQLRAYAAANAVAAVEQRREARGLGNAVTDAYRDDLEATRLRVLELEREHAALEVRHAELEARKAALAAPVVKRVASNDVTAGESSAFAATLAGTVLACMLAGASGLATVVLVEWAAFAAGGALALRRWMLRRKR